MEKIALRLTCAESKLTPPNRLQQEMKDLTDSGLIRAKEQHVMVNPAYVAAATFKRSKDESDSDNSKDFSQSHRK